MSTLDPQDPNYSASRVATSRSLRRNERLTERALGMGPRKVVDIQFCIKPLVATKSTSLPSKIPVLEPLSRSSVVPAAGSMQPVSNTSTIESSGRSPSTDCQFQETPLLPHPSLPSSKAAAGELPERVESEKMEVQTVDYSHDNSRLQRCRGAGTHIIAETEFLIKPIAPQSRPIVLPPSVGEVGLDRVEVEITDENRSDRQLARQRGAEARKIADTRFFIKPMLPPAMEVAQGGVEVGVVAMDQSHQDNRLHRKRGAGTHCVTDAAFAIVPLVQPPAGPPVSLVGEVRVIPGGELEAQEEVCQKACQPGESV